MLRKSHLSAKSMEHKSQNSLTLQLMFGQRKIRGG